MRQRVYDLLETLLFHFTTVDNMEELTGFISQSNQNSGNLSLARNQLTGEDVINGVLRSIAGEKDPRCLLQCFRIIQYLSTVFAPIISQHSQTVSKPLATTLSAAYVPSLPEKIFEAASCYFPITFHPPPNDPYGITHDLLVTTLMEAMISHHAFLPSLLHLLIDHIVNPSEEESMYHGILYLRQAILRYGMLAPISSILHTIWSPIYNILTASPMATTLPELNSMHPPLHSPQTQEPSMDEMAIFEAIALVKIICSKSAASIPPQNSDTMWSQFGHQLVNKSLTAINWMIAKHEFLHNPTAQSLFFSHT